MPIVRSEQYTFSGGQSDEAYVSRVDQEMYAKTALKLENVLVDSSGGAIQRYGTELMGRMPVKDSTTSLGGLATYTLEAAVLIPFENDRVDDYVVMLCNMYAVPATLSPGRQPKHIVRCAVFKMSGGKYVSTTEITLPTSVARVYQNVKYAQSGNTIIVVHETFPPFRIVRSGDTWTATELDITAPPRDTTVVSTTPVTSVTLSSKVGYQGLVSATITAGSALPATGGKTYEIWSEGMLIAYAYKNTGTNVWDAVLLSTITSTTIDKAVEARQVAPYWKAGQYPTTVAFFQGRLIFAHDRHIWASRAGDLFNFAGGDGNNPAGAVSVQLSDFANIYDIYPARELLIFTDRNVKSVSAQGGITSSNIAVTTATNDGTFGLPPIGVGGDVLFVDVGGRTVRKFVYNNDEQNYIAPSISEPMLRSVNNPRSVCLQRYNPLTSNATVYYMNEDGSISALSYIGDTPGASGMSAWSTFHVDVPDPWSMCVVNNRVYLLGYDGDTGGRRETACVLYGFVESSLLDGARVAESHTEVPAPVWLCAMGRVLDHSYPVIMGDVIGLDLIEDNPYSYRAIPPVVPYDAKYNGLYFMDDFTINVFRIDQIIDTIGEPTSGFTNKFGSRFRSVDNPNDLYMYLKHPELRTERGVFNSLLKLDAAKVTEYINYVETYGDPYVLQLLRSPELVLTDRIYGTYPLPIASSAVIAELRRVFMNEDGYSSVQDDAIHKQRWAFLTSGDTEALGLNPFYLYDALRDNWFGTVWANIDARKFNADTQAWVDEGLRRYRLMTSITIPPRKVVFGRSFATKIWTLPIDKNIGIQTFISSIRRVIELEGIMECSQITVTCGDNTATYYGNIDNVSVALQNTYDMMRDQKIKLPATLSRSPIVKFERTIPGVLSIRSLAFKMSVLYGG